MDMPLTAKAMVTFTYTHDHIAHSLDNPLAISSSPTGATIPPCCEREDVETEIGPPAAGLSVHIAESYAHVIVPALDGREGSEYAAKHGVEKQAGRRQLEQTVKVQWVISENAVSTKWIECNLEEIGRFS